MYSTSQLQEIFTKELYSERFDYMPRELYEPIGYIMSLGGKRIRPVLLLMACDLFGSDIRKAIPAALGVEMFHNFTLVHDDIMDDAPLRRGKVTIHEKWNTDIAILSGDTMMALAYEYFLKLDEDVIKQVLHLFSKTTKEVCEGQQYDMNFETKPDVNIDQYMEMIRLKTAVLIGACLKIGGIISHASGEDLDNLYQFGLHTGLAFQLKDDLLDVYGDEEKFGKKNYGDIVTNKKTFLYLKAFEAARGKDLDMLTHYFSGNPVVRDEKVKEVKKIFDTLGIRSLTEDMIREEGQLASLFLDKVSAGEPKKQELKKFAGELIDRKL
jgi:geranylgeranyl diphosphate synthase type II